MSERAGANFIHKKDSSLQLSGPVEQTQEQRKHKGLETSQKPAIRLSNWFEVLERTHLARGASKERQAKHEQVLERIKTSYHKLFVVKPAEIPESVFRLEVRLARERGEGNIRPYEEFKEAKSQEIITAQESSLDKWVDYLTSEDADSAGYPMWARYWAFMAVIKMGLMEKHVKEDGAVEIKFGKRDEHTVAPFAELNPKALAQTIQAMQHQLEQEGLPKAERSLDNTSKVLSDQKFAQMLSEGSFAKIYGQFLAENPSITTERLKETRGEWVRYEHGSDATELYDSLQGHTLEWCTAGAVSTAQSQLDGGDFYVYYSLDANGQPTIPRIAIRKEYNQIAEIRGIEHDQHLDPYIGEVLEGQLKNEQEFPNAKEYMQGAEDMKLVTAIEHKMGARYNDLEAEFLGYDNPHAELSKEELEFIYELERKIVSLGYGEDPRAEQIVQNRDFIADMAVICETSDHNQIAQALIEADAGWAVADNLEKFQGLDHNQIAQALIEADAGLAVVDNLEKFQGLDNTTAQALIEADKGWAVAKNLEKFQGLDHNQIAQAIIAGGKGRVVADNLDKFQGLDNATAQALIDKGEGRAVADNLEKFQGLDHNQIAQALIAADRGDAVAYNLEKFQDLELNNEFALKLIESGGGPGVADNLEKFQGLDHNQIAQALIDKGQGSSVARNPDKFQGLDHNQIAQALIEAGAGRAVADYLEKFQGLDNTTAQALIEAGAGWAVAKNLEKFQGLDNATAQALIRAGAGSSVADNLEKFQGLDNTTAQALIEAGAGWAVADNLDKFQGLDHNQIAQALIEAGAGWAVADNLEKFQDLELNNEFALKLIESGGGSGVADNLEKFQGLDHNQIAQALIDKGQGSSVADNLEKFQGLDHNQTAQAIIAGGQGRVVANNLNKFQGLDHNQIAQAIIAAGEIDAVARNLDKFQDLDATTARALIAAGESYAVARNLDKFQGLSEETMEKLKPHLDKK